MSKFNRRKLAYDLPKELSIKVRFQFLLDNEQLFHAASEQYFYWSKASVLHDLILKELNICEQDWPSKHIDYICRRYEPILTADLAEQIFTSVKTWTEKIDKITQEELGIDAYLKPNKVWNGVLIGEDVNDYKQRKYIGDFSK